jgi:hypothetical protein
MFMMRRGTQLGVLTVRTYNDFIVFISIINFWIQIWICIVRIWIWIGYLTDIQIRIGYRTYINMNMNIFQILNKNIIYIIEK